MAVEDAPSWCNVAETSDYGTVENLPWKCLQRTDEMCRVKWMNWDF